MREKGFATILGLCLILAVALVVKGIQGAETNHAREVSNFQMEQVLQLAAESGIIKAAELVHDNPSLLPEPDTFVVSKKKIPVYYDGEQKITLEVWGERGDIYLCPENTDKVSKKDSHDGVYFMSCASMESNFWSRKLYRRAYAYVLNGNERICFMELPVRGKGYVTRKDK